MPAAPSSKLASTLMAKLVALSGVLAGREYPLGELCIVGRSPNAHVRLPDLAVSRQHAKITRAGDRYTLEDMDSGSGTVVNDHYVTVSRLRPGDEIEICSFRFRFVDAPVDRLSTSEYALVCNESDARVISVDAAHLSQLPPSAAQGKDEAISTLTRRLNAVLAVGQAASRAPEPKVLLDEVMTHCLEVFPQADRAMVAMPDREAQSLVVHAMALRQGIEPSPLTLSRNVVSEVLYKGRSVMSSRETDGAGGGNGRPGGPIMVAPLITQGQMLGLVYVDMWNDGPALTEDDLSVLSGVAAHLALALHAANLRETLLSRSRTEQELTAANEVQKRFLPRGVPNMAGFSFVAHYDPCRDVGGDLYDFIRLDARHLGVVIGDVSGKGFAAALVMAWTTSQVRVAAHQERDPATVLEQVNEALLEAHQDDLFVTLFYGVLDRVTRTLRYCNAGHVPPLVRRASGEVELLDTGTGLPVGVVEGATFEEHRLGLEQGDTVLLVTDGVTEAMNGSRTMFGLEGLAAAMGQSVPPVSNMVSDVLGELRGFVGGETQYDDITIVAIGAGGSLEDVTTTLPPGLITPDLVDE